MGLKDKKILLIGGDERYLEVIKALESLQAKIILAGYEKAGLPLVHAEILPLQNVDFSNLDAVLLPVSGTDGAGNISMAPFTEHKLYLTEKMIAALPDHCRIYTGVAGDFLKRMEKTYHIEIVPILARDDIAIYNSIPTAEGTLQLAMEQTNYTMHGANVLVLGFGKVGITTARLFSVIGSHVSVAVRRADAVARIREMRLQAVYMNNLTDSISDYQIIINTIPDLVLDSSLLKAVSTETLIIDLASNPGGVDFHAANQHGIKALHALGLPGKVAPKTAGEIIADTFVQLLKRG